VEVVKVLLDRGANENATLSDGFSVLHTA